MLANGEIPNVGLTNLVKRHKKNSRDQSGTYLRWPWRTVAVALVANAKFIWLVVSTPLNNISQSG